MEVVAIHMIMRGKSAKPNPAKPLSVFVTDGDELAHLLKAGAVQKATEDQIAYAKAKGLYFGERAAVLDLDSETEAEAAEKAAAEAAEKAEAEAAETAAAEAAEKAEAEAAEKAAAEAAEKAEAEAAATGDVDLTTPAGDLEREALKKRADHFELDYAKNMPTDKLVELVLGHEASLQSGDGSDDAGGETLV